MSYLVIGTEWCPFCMKVKNHLENKKVEHKWVDSDTQEGTQLRNKESKKHNFKTIPMVFKGDKFIGGCNEYFAKL